MAITKKLSVITVAKFQAVLAAYLGLFAGIIYSFGGLIYDLFTTGLNWGTLMAFGALIGMPLVFGALGAVLGVVEAILFNIFARWFGGIDIDFRSPA